MSVARDAFTVYLQKGSGSMFSVITTQQTVEKHALRHRHLHPHCLFSRLSKHNSLICAGIKVARMV